MKPADLNIAIAELDMLDPPIWRSPLGGKTFPYFGPEYRNLPFYKKTWTVAVSEDLDGNRVVGFLDDNPWKFQTYDLSPEQTDTAQDLIEIALKEMTDIGFEDFYSWLLTTVPEELCA